MVEFPTFMGSWPWPWIGSYCIPSYITRWPLPTYQISLKSKKLFVDRRTDIWDPLIYEVESEESTQRSRPYKGTSSRHQHRLRLGWNDLSLLVPVTSLPPHVSDQNLLIKVALVSTYKMPFVIWLMVSKHWRNQKAMTKQRKSSIDLIIALSATWQPTMLPKCCHLPSSASDSSMLEFVCYTNFVIIIIIWHQLSHASETYTCCQLYTDQIVNIEHSAWILIADDIQDPQTPHAADLSWQRRQVVVTQRQHTQLYTLADLQLWQLLNNDWKCYSYFLCISYVR